MAGLDHVPHRSERAPYAPVLAKRDWCGARLAAHPLVQLHPGALRAVPPGTPAPSDGEGAPRP